MNFIDTLDGWTLLSNNPELTGGFGEISTYKQNNVKIAVKRFKDIGLSDDVVREVAILTLLKDTDIVPHCYGVCLSGIKSFLCLELATYDLLEFSEEPDDVREHFFPHVVHSTSYCIATLHSFGIIHADIKPENFLVFRDRTYPRIVLIDFGFSSATPDNDVYTDYYKPPEVNDRITYKSDIWALGITLLVYIRQKILKVDTLWLIDYDVFPPYNVRYEIDNMFFHSRDSIATVYNMLFVEPEKRQLPIAIPIQYKTPECTINDDLLVYSSRHSVLQLASLIMARFLDGTNPNNYSLNGRIKTNNYGTICLACVDLAEKLCTYYDAYYKDVDIEVEDMEIEIIKKLRGSLL